MRGASFDESSLACVVCGPLAERCRNSPIAAARYPSTGFGPGIGVAVAAPGVRAPVVVVGFMSRSPTAFVAVWAAYNEYVDVACVRARQQARSEPERCIKDSVLSASCRVRFSRKCSAEHSCRGVVASGGPSGACSWRRRRACAPRVGAPKRTLLPSGCGLGRAKEDRGRCVRFIQVLPQPSRTSRRTA